MLLHHNGPFCKLRGEANTALFRTIHPQSCVDRCGILPRWVGETQGGYQKFRHSEWCSGIKMKVCNSADEIQSITSVVQNAVIMPIVRYVRVHLVQSC